MLVEALAVIRRRALVSDRRSDGTDGPANRTAARARTLVAGKIVYGDGAYSCDCVIRDISPSGARVSGIAGMSIPRDFFLIDQKRAVAFDATLAWRNGTQAGVRFHKAIDLSTLADPHLDFLRRLHVESRLR